jgi:hypothetical protein
MLANLKHFLRLPPPFDCPCALFLAHPVVCQAPRPLNYFQFVRRRPCPLKVVRWCRPPAARSSHTASKSSHTAASKSSQATTSKSLQATTSKSSHAERATSKSPPTKPSSKRPTLARAAKGNCNAPMDDSERSESALQDPSSEDQGGKTTPLGTGEVRATFIYLSFTYLFV